MIYTVTYWSWYQYLNNPQVIKATLEIVPTKDDWLIVFQPYDSERRQLVLSIIEKFDYSKRVLIHYEGKYRQPHGFKLRYQQLFGRIYTYSSTDVDDDTVKYMPIPLWISENDCQPIGIRSKFICSVITNCYNDKEPRSIITKKLQSLGMDVYGGAGNPIPGDIEINKINVPKYSAKIKLMSKYTFAFVAENQLDLGHVTEKPFDAIAAGCIPIYLGPNDSFKFIPSNCYIDYRDFWCENSLINYIKNMTKEKIQEYQNAISQNQKALIGMRTYESCMRFLCKDLGFECEAPYYKQILELSKIISRGI